MPPYTGKETLRAVIPDRPNTTIIAQSNLKVNNFLSTINNFCGINKIKLYTLYNLRIAIPLRMCYFIVTRGDTDVQVNLQGSKYNRKP